MDLSGCLAFVEAYEDETKVVLVLVGTHDAVRTTINNISREQGRATPSRGDALVSMCMPSESGFLTSGRSDSGEGITAAVVPVGGHCGN